MQEKKPPLETGTRQFWAQYPSQNARPTVCSAISQLAPSRAHKK